MIKAYVYFWCVKIILIIFRFTYLTCSKIFILPSIPFEEYNPELCRRPSEEENKPVTTNDVKTGVGSTLNEELSSLENKADSTWLELRPIIFLEDIVETDEK